MADLQPDGSNPLARVELFAQAGWDGDATIFTPCVCGSHVLPATPDPINLQDLVIAAQDHAGECPLHEANLAAIQRKRNRD